MLSVLNECLVREFLKLLSILHKTTAVTTDVCLVSDDHSLLSQMLCSFSHEMTYLLSRCSNQAGVSTDHADVSTDQAGVSSDRAGVSTDWAGVSTDRADVSTDQAGVSTDRADVSGGADKLCCKLLAWLPHVTHICRSLLCSDTVSQFV